MIGQQVNWLMNWVMGCGGKVWWIFPDPAPSESRLEWQKQKGIHSDYKATTQGMTWCNGNLVLGRIASVMELVCWYLPGWHVQGFMKGPITPRPRLEYHPRLEPRHHRRSKLVKIIYLNLQLVFNLNIWAGRSAVGLSQKVAWSWSTRTSGLQLGMVRKKFRLVRKFSLE